MYYHFPPIFIYGKNYLNQASLSYSYFHTHKIEVLPPNSTTKKNKFVAYVFMETSNLFQKKWQETRKLAICAYFCTYASSERIADQHKAIITSTSFNCWWDFLNMKDKLTNLLFSWSAAQKYQREQSSILNEKSADLWKTLTHEMTSKHWIN